MKQELFSYVYFSCRFEYFKLEIKMCFYSKRISMSGTSS
jgi:hypothetical protein